ncbi:chemotaxis protein CheB [Reinekea marinisedimentorum]|uniref:protein-glutamate methylesterase n=1 Tax=Reinekea marinisedimentorum TaxID=230495 RepID=A0A4R3ICC7_9GAMM|nr:chemotaxis protein CheB [Reinekea marinisedimentorum]TCS43216.1 chemosensory pili system protein ChpB (putative protein-glutamate methylesterase) [Reinekea marinisedimentorum]
MKGKLNRVGIIASTPLVRHQMQTAVADAGYEVAVNTSPERLDTNLLTNETIRLWAIELEEDDRWADFINQVVELVEVPVLFGDAVIPTKNSDNYSRWLKRIHRKLHALAPTVSKPASAPDVDLDLLDKKPEQPIFSLPDALKRAPRTDVNHVWVLCASLGGPQAVKDLLDLLPGDIPASFLYAQHIDAGCLDSLVQSVGRHTALDMKMADHGLQLENGKVFVVPVTNEVVFTDNHGILWQNNEWSGPYGPSLDQLLKNVSEKYGAHCNAIIFSGMGSDGAIGAALVKENGGEVWAQSAASCVQSSMPDSAAETGSVDWRGTPAEIAEKLIEWLADKSQAAT